MQFDRISEMITLAIDWSVPRIRDTMREVNVTLEQFERWQIILFTLVIAYIVYLIHDFWEHELEKGIISYLKIKIFNVLRRLPFVQGKISGEIKKTKRGLQEGVLKQNKGQPFIQRMPENGMTSDKVIGLADEYLKLSSDFTWKNGAISGCVYGADKDLEELTTKIYSKFAWTNPLHPDVFADVRKMEAEVVRWVCTLFNGDEEACGAMSSGGTESIMLACRAYRQLAYSKGIRKPEIVCPVTAHAAFDKAAEFFCMKIHHVPVDPKTKKVNVKKMKSYINENTCMLVGSAPHFPHGVIDPIEDLSKLAVKYNIPLHVDACLGGFLIVFMREAGYPLPPFDFSLPGVTSISCDTHKYGYTPKGSSLVMYRNSEYRKHQYFSAVDWPGGIYASPTFAGSRPGSLVAMTWATLAHIGHQGYIKITKDVVTVTRYIANEIRQIPELELMGTPEVSIVAFTSSHFNILNLMDDMAERGWHLNALQNPSGVHIAVTKLHTQKGVAERFVIDIKETVASIMKRSDRKLGKVASIYCSKQGVPDKSLIVDTVYAFLDTNLSTKESINGSANGVSKQKAAKSGKHE